MRTQQLERALRGHRDVRPYFMGVYASDLLPRTIPKGKPRLLVANTDPSQRPGKHWVAYYFTAGDTVYYFDSTGQPPYTPTLQRLLRNRRRHRVFGRRIQGMDRTCGYYCLYFILAMVRGYSFECFGDDLNANDRLVRRLVREHFRVT